MTLNNIINKIRLHPILFNILIILSFIFLSIFNIALTYVLHRYPVGYDMSFHWQRIYELLRSNEIFPRLALNSFNDSGSGSMTMYPYLLLYPMVFIFKFVHSVYLCSIISFLLMTFVALCISYYSSLMVSNSKLSSYIFSLAYSISFSLFLNGVSPGYALGMNFSFIFMPLLLFGFILWLNNGRWVPLSIGMSLIIYSSVIMMLIVLSFLLIYLCFHFKMLNMKKIINLAKAAILTLATTALFWVPALNLILHNHLVNMGMNNITGVSIPHIIDSSVDATLINSPSVSGVMTIYSLLGIIMGGIYFRKLDRTCRHIYIASILCLLVSSNWFFWVIIDHTPLDIIQRPWRLYLIPQVFLSYLLALIIAKVLIKKFIHNPVKIFNILLVIILFICGLQFTNETVSLKQVLNPSDTEKPCVNNKLFLEPPVSTDYYPVNAAKYVNNITRHQIKENNGDRIKFKALGNGSFSFNTNHVCKPLTIPFLYYHMQNYHTYLDGKLVKSHSDKNQLMTIHKVSRGYHKIHITVPPTKIDMDARAITFMSLFAYIFIVINRCLRYYHKKD